MTFFLDANVPMYAVGREHRYKAPCLRILEAVATRDLDGVSSSEVVQEILHRFFSLGEREKALSVAADFLALLRQGILSVGVADMAEVLEIARSYPQLSARDLVHVATMRTNGLKDIVSADAHFDGVAGIIRHDPEVLARTLGR